MKILFQGGWKEKRDPSATKEPITAYCKSLAKHVIHNGHQILLTSVRQYDTIIANEVVIEAKKQQKNVKDHLLFLLPARIRTIPKEGRVRRFGGTRWWIEERTFFVQNADVVVAIGGGRGTFDCVEKAFLSGKPVFVVAAIPSRATEAWKNRNSSYKYLEDGDAEFLDDLNVTPDEYFQGVFNIINSLAEIRYSRRVFIVHGRDEHARDALVSLLGNLQFEPIVLQDEPSKSMTIIEKLERDTENVGFGFVLYSPDDLGHLPGQSERPRARQNVVFEHGLLIGLLGRERTCAIIKGELEIPSDIQGMIYERIDSVNKDSLKIARILKEAGYKVDISTLL